MSLSTLSIACAVCFGDPNALSSKALTVAVFFLFGVVIFVLSGIAWTGFVWSRRAKELGTGDPSGRPYTNEVAE